MNPGFPLMIADENMGGVESCNKLAHKEAHPAPTYEQETVVDCNQSNINLSKNERVQCCECAVPPPDYHTSTSNKGTGRGTP